MHTVSEINVAERYEVPKAQNITLTSGDADLTVNVNFVNDLKKGSIKINKQSEDGFEVGRMEKSDIKRMLAIYFEASMNGEEIPDTEGEIYLEVQENV